MGNSESHWRTEFRLEPEAVGGANRECSAAHKIAKTLLGYLASIGVHAEVLAVRSERWSSVTFAGHRIKITLSADKDSADLGAKLSNENLDVPRHLVVDVYVESVEHDRITGRDRVELTLLTVDST